MLAVVVIVVLVFATDPVPEVVPTVAAVPGPVLTATTVVVMLLLLATLTLAFTDCCCDNDTKDDDDGDDVGAVAGGGCFCGIMLAPGTGLTLATSRLGTFSTAGWLNVTLGNGSR